MEIIYGLFVILLLVLLLPFLVKPVEHNLEIFLFIMGLLAAGISGYLTLDLGKHILHNHLLYMITFAVLIAGFLFNIAKRHIQKGMDWILRYCPLPLFVFCVVVFLGLASSVITAIIASLLLVEILHALPLSHKQKVGLAVIACYSIGLGAVLTPIGEPLSTIATSRLHKDFFYLLRELGFYVIPGVIAFSILGAFFVKKAGAEKDSQKIATEEETHKDVILRAVKIFVFIVALELLGTGFKPIIDRYILPMSQQVLYWLNMVSAILDNATLAAAELSPEMTSAQIRSILMGLLIAGGMLIPGNIPNIISASKLKITSKEWAKPAVPLGLIAMVIFYIILFVL